MRDKQDDLIDQLIRPPRPVFTGFDWSTTEKLKPTGDASRHRVLAETLQPMTELRDE